MRKRRSNEAVLLLPCDEVQDSYLSWTCGANYNIHMSDFGLGYAFIYDKWVVVGASLILKIRHSTESSGWIIYSSNGKFSCVGHDAVFF